MSPMKFVLRRVAPAALLLAVVPTLRAQTAPGADALAKLVPEGTAVYVQAPSLERLGNAVRKVIAAFDKEKAQSFDLDAMIAEGELPISPKNIDHSKPIAFCLVLPEGQGSDPAPTLLLPATNPDELVKEIAGSGMPFKTAVENGYVTVSMSPDAKHGAGPVAIATGLPAGEIVARIDLKRLVAHFRPMIDMGLAQLQMMMAAVPAQAAGGIDIAPVMKLYGDGIRAVIDSGETLDLALKLDGNRCEIASALTAQEKSSLAEFGSKEKTDVKSLARYVDTSSAMGFAFGLEPAMLAKRFRPILDAALTMYPEPMRTDLQKSMGSLDELTAVMGSAMAAGGNFGATGIKYSIYMRPKDPKKLVEVYKTMMKAMPSMSVGEPKDETVDGIPVTRMRLKVDAKAFADAMQKKSGAKPGGPDVSADVQKMIETMYGKDGLEFTVGTKGDVTAVILGGDEAFQKAALARLSTPGAVPGGIARGLDQVGDLNPCFVLQYDIGKMMHEMQGMMGSAFQGSGLTFPDVSASLTSWLGVDGRKWNGAMSVDLAELGAFATAMKNAENAKSPAPAPTKK
jgi:hypothetical protein